MESKRFTSRLVLCETGMQLYSQGFNSIVTQNEQCKQQCLIKYKMFDLQKILYNTQSETTD